MYKAFRVLDESYTQQLKGTLELLTQIFPNDGSAIYLVNGRTYDLITHHGNFSFANALDNKNFSQQLLQQKLSLTKQNDPKDKLWMWRSVNGTFQKVVTEPLQIENEPIGFLCIGFGKGQGYKPNNIEVLSTYINLIEITIKNAALYQETTIQNEFLRTLHKVSIVNGSDDYLLTKLGKCACEIGNYYIADAIAIFLSSHFGERFPYAAGWGNLLDDLKQHSLDSKYGLEKSVAHHREIKYLPTKQSQTTVGCSSHSFASLIAAPLIASDNVYGIMEIGFSEPIGNKFDRKEHLQAYADQVAHLIQTDIHLHGIQLSSEALIQAYDALLEAWSYALELRDFETRGHSQRVVELVCKLGEKLGIQGDDLDNLRRGALLHDIGKLGIPDHILLKPSSLTEDEWQVMRKHPIYAKEMLSRIPFLMPILDIPCYHHERWDGSGYPYGLAREEIPFPARIFSIVDVWDALNSNRPYRQAWKKPKIIQYIENENGKHFDPAVVKAFLPLVSG